MVTKVQIMQIRWAYHYDPPNGMPKVLAQEVVETPDSQGAVNMDRIEALYKEHKPIKGYWLSWSCLTKPPRRLNSEARSKIRKSRMVTKIQRKYPLFADEFIQDELDQNKEYYAGEQPKEQKEFIAACDAEDIQNINDAKNNVGLTIFHKWWDDSNAEFSGQR